MVRQFSSSSVRGALVRPPIQVSGTEGRYATALYSAGTKTKTLETVEKELITLQGTLNKGPRIAEFLRDPSRSRSSKKVVIEKLCKTELKLSDMVTQLFAVMAENGRANSIPAVLGSFEKIMAAHRGEIAGSVVTAKALSPAEHKELLATLNGFLEKGMTLQLTTEVDPSLIGGMKITIGDKFVDMSMATKIKTYTELIKQTV